MSIGIELTWLHFDDVSCASLHSFQWCKQFIASKESWIELWFWCLEWYDGMNAFLDGSSDSWRWFSQDRVQLWLLSSVPRGLKFPQQTLQKHVLRIQNHLIQDSSSSAGVPYMYVYIFFNSFGAILHLHCTDFYQTYILFFNWSCGREKFTLYCVFFFFCNFFICINAQTCLLTNFYCTSKALCKMYFFYVYIA